MKKMARRKVSVMPITKARVNLGAVVRRVHLNKEYVILEKGGIPVVGIMDADELEDYLELQDPEVQEQIRISNEDIRAGRTRPAEEHLEEVMSRSTPRNGRNRRQRK
ncbi:MAG: type II toxin-antitoxin system Phd/YefM family antitoxin [Acidobacteria bacterium]|nr:type II toxin-antitoxin system Phd/YefM family antitoxin [Acidobacteriota bacterium]